VGSAPTLRPGTCPVAAPVLGASTWRVARRSIQCKGNVYFGGLNALPTIRALSSFPSACCDHDSTASFPPDSSCASLSPFSPPDDPTNRTPFPSSWRAWGYAPGDSSGADCVISQVHLSRLYDVRFRVWWCLLPMARICIKTYLVNSADCDREVNTT
jgi:hypothetical protein